MLNHRQTYIIIIIFAVSPCSAQEREKEREETHCSNYKIQTNFILAVHDKKKHERNKLPALTVYTRKSPVNKYSKIHICRVCRCCYCCGGVVAVDGGGDGGNDDDAKYEQTIYKCIRQHSYTQGMFGGEFDFTI